MQNINNNLSVEEIVNSYNDKKISETNISIYVGRNKDRYLIKSIHGDKDNINIFYDPERVLRVGSYIGVYYCNTLKDLKIMVDFLVNESLLKTSNLSDDLLDYEGTKRYDLNEIDKMW